VVVVEEEEPQPWHAARPALPPYLTNRRPTAIAHFSLIFVMLSSSTRRRREIRRRRRSRRTWVAIENFVFDLGAVAEGFVGLTTRTRGG